MRGKRKCQGGVSVWDFLLLIPDKEILIQTYPYPNIIKDYGSPINTFGNDRWVVILRTPSVVLHPSTVILRESGVSSFLTGIQKIAKINSGSVKKRFEFGAVLNIFSCRKQI